MVQCFNCPEHGREVHEECGECQEPWPCSDEQVRAALERHRAEVTALILATYSDSGLTERESNRLQVKVNETFDDLAWYMTDDCCKPPPWPGRE